MKNAFLIFSIAIGCLFACVKNEKKEAKSIEKIDATSLRVADSAMKSLKVEKIFTQEMPERLDLMGKVGVTEDRTTMVPARVAGRIDAVFLASGESVTEGQPMASLISPDFVAAREEYLQSLKQSRIISEEGAAQDFASLSQLAQKRLKNMGLSDDDIANLPKSEANGSSFIVRAPRSGVIIDKKAVLGNVVNPGDALFTVADINKVWFSGDVYSEDLPKVRKNQEVVIDQVPGGEAIYGKISLISPIVDPVARTIKIRALMNNPKGVLRAEMYVHGGVILNKKKALLIPTTSIIRSGDHDYVYRRLEGNTFQRTTVTLGEEVRNLTAISSGIKEGDEVVSEGALYLEGALTSSET